MTAVLVGGIVLLGSQAIFWHWNGQHQDRFYILKRAYMLCFLNVGFDLCGMASSDGRIGSEGLLQRLQCSLGCEWTSVGSCNLKEREEYF